MSSKDSVVVSKSTSRPQQGIEPKYRIVSTSRGEERHRTMLGNKRCAHSLSIVTQPADPVDICQPSDTHSANLLTCRLSRLSTAHMGMKCWFSLSGRRRCHGKSDCYPLGVQEVCSWRTAALRGLILWALSGILYIQGAHTYPHTCECIVSDMYTDSHTHTHESFWQRNRI